ncbi:MAG: alpha-amylase family glycosyl hydrolase, partial [Candidatus Saccharimonas sp.]
VYCFGNHDQWRMVTRYGDEERARLVALLQFTLPGLPVVYYGDELGMPNTEIQPDEVQDLSVFSSGRMEVGRDPERTPMQWHKGRYAGFSETRPWLPVGQSVNKHNVETQLHEPDSVLSLYRRLLKLRTRYDILRHGSYEAFGELDLDVFNYARWLGDQHVFVALNFGNKTQQVKLPHKGRILCSTHPIDYPDMTKDGTVTLRPCEGVLVECAEHPIEH